jgi:DNA-binding NtrC family response regulator
VDKARGNLSAAARSLGLTRAQLAYRLKRLQEESQAGTATDASASSLVRGPT